MSVVTTRRSPGRIVRKLSLKIAGSQRRRDGCREHQVWPRPPCAPLREKSCMPHTRPSGQRSASRISARRLSIVTTAGMPISLCIRVVDLSIRRAIDLEGRAGILVGVAGIDADAARLRLLRIGGIWSTSSATTSEANTWAMSRLLYSNGQ
jgi:hypothetical protein